MNLPHDASSLAGALLVTGFDGPTLTGRSAEALTRGERAGLILFKRNLPDVAGTLALTAAIRAATPAGLPALVAVDEEGGRVSRLPPGEPRLGPMRALGARGDEALVHDAGHAVGARLFELGFNWDFAPILDVDSNPANPVIGDRSFSRDPAEVARLALAFARGLNAGGVLACGKHFPGHGDTDKDSHFDLPVVRHDRARLDALELLPFRRAAEAGLESIMSAHVVMEAIDARVPATFARSAMTTLLREELGFRGVLVSDDLEMKAVAADHAPEESALIAIGAGCDLLLVCKEEDAADACHAALTREIEKSAAFRARASEAAGRVAALRDRARTLGEMRRPGPSIAEVLARGPWS